MKQIIEYLKKEHYKIYVALFESDIRKTFYRLEVKSKSLDGKAITENKDGYQIWAELSYGSKLIEKVDLGHAINHKERIKISNKSFQAMRDELA